MKLTYLQIDSLIVQQRPLRDPILDTPCFGASLLKEKQFMRQANRTIEEVDERELFLELLYKDTQRFQKGGYASGVCLYVFGVSVTQWIVFEGACRNALWTAKDPEIAQIVEEDTKLFHLSLRQKSTNNALRLIRKVLEDDARFSWLSSEAFSKMGSYMEIWYNGFWKHHLTEQGKILSDHAEDIEKHGKGRMDQIVTFGWSRSCIGDVRWSHRWRWELIALMIDSAR